MTIISLADFAGGPAYKNLEQADASTFNRPLFILKREINEGFQKYALLAGEYAPRWVSSRLYRTGSVVSSFKPVNFTIWDDTSTYNEFDLVFDEGVRRLYVCKTTNTNKVPRHGDNVAFWQVLSSVTPGEGGILQNTHDVWLSTTTYAKGAITNYKGSLYYSKISGNIANHPFKTQFWLKYGELQTYRYTKVNTQSGDIVEDENSSPLPPYVNIDIWTPVEYPEEYQTNLFYTTGTIVKYNGDLYQLYSHDEINITQTPADRPNQWRKLNIKDESLEIGTY
jgi:chitodextrinase